MRHPHYTSMLGLFVASGLFVTIWLHSSFLREYMLDCFETSQDCNWRIKFSEKLAAAKRDYKRFGPYCSGTVNLWYPNQSKPIEIRVNSSDYLISPIRKFVYFLFWKHPFNIYLSFCSLTFFQGRVLVMMLHRMRSTFLNLN